MRGEGREFLGQRAGRRRWRVERCRGERDREGAPGPQELVDIELSTERLVMPWEAVEVFVELGAFAILFAENDLVVDQVEKIGGIDP